MDVRARFNVQVVADVSVPTAPRRPTMVLAHGFGCAQSMWRFVVPAFTDTYRVVVFDHAGCGAADHSAYDPERHATLDGYAADLIEIVEAVADGPVTLVGHSVSSMIAVLVATARPDLVERLVLVSPSPRYIDDAGYRGGFTAQEIDELLETMDANYLGWSQVMAPVIAGNPDRPGVGDELADYFSRADPDAARRFARATFLGDNRADLGRVRTPTLVVQSRVDPIAPAEVGQYVHEHLPHSELVTIDSFGHCPNLSHPDLVVAAMRGWLEES